MGSEVGSKKIEKLLIYIYLIRILFVYAYVFHRYTLSASVVKIENNHQNQYYPQIDIAPITYCVRASNIHCELPVVSH